MRFSVLASGSTGNAVLISGGPTHILVDAGLSGKELKNRLATVGVEPEQISAIIITHEHGDHTLGAGIFARRHGATLMMTHRTRDACASLLRGTEQLVIYRPGYPFHIGDLFVEPFITAHDAVDPVAVAVGDQTTGLRLGIATDLGRPTVQVRHALRGCDGLIVESNYDELMLWSGGYPQSVKARISSSHGHLSNQAAASFLTDLVSPRLSAVVLAHLSAESNTPHLAKTVVGGALRTRGFRGQLHVAGPDKPTDMLDLGVLRDQAGPSQLSLF